MGFGDVVGTLVGFASSTFHISKAEAGLLPFLGFIAYGVISVPAGVISDRIGKKKLLMISLAVCLVGLIIPFLWLSSYFVLAVSILLLGSGMAVLQVAANPLMRDVSASGKYSRNLSFAQFVKSIGSLSGSLLTVFVLTSWTGLFPLYASVTAVALLLVWQAQIAESPGDVRASVGGSFSLLKNPYILMMVTALFLYVGAEVGMNSWIATYLNSVHGLDISRFATLGIGFFFVSLLVGRLTGAMILNWTSPRKFFLLTSLFSIAGIVGLFLGNREIAVASIVLIGLGFANVFPLIFSILIDAFPEKSSELSGLMVMAIVGGAVMPLLMGFIADYSVLLSFLVPLFSFVFIALSAFVSLKKS